MTALRDSRRFPPTRSAGLRRLAGFVPDAGRAYTTGRNSDDGPDDRACVSTLSPYLRHRLVTEREVLGAVLQRHALPAAEKFVQEVCWRTYFKGHLETRPQIWTRYRSERDTQLALLSAGGGLEQAYKRAAEGRTGIDCFDAWMDELRETGYLHNHARMWLASIWIFTLRLPWELGADLTYRHFLDGDPASNTLSWRWVAGLHTKGKTYLARPSNIAEYTRGRFAPTGLAASAVALNEEPIGPASPLSPAPAHAPEGPAILLLTTEDLHPESLDLARAGIRAVIGTDATALRSPLPVPEPVLAFAGQALADGVARASRHFAAAAIDGDASSAQNLIELARRHRASRIVTAYVPVGPMADRLAGWRHDLDAEGIDLVQIRRPEDSAAWPLATNGFFGLREKIPQLLAALGPSGPDAADPDVSLHAFEQGRSPPQPR